MTDGVSFDGLSEEEARVAMAEVVAGFAAEHDFDLTVEDIVSSDVAEGELSDVELEAVSGGHCGCFIIGAVKGCGCVFFGGAHLNDYGEPDSEGTFCAAIGA